MGRAPSGRTSNHFFPMVLAMVVLGALWPEPASWASDTTETFPVGVSEVDLFSGFEGMGRRRGERALSGDFMLGIGLIERLSAFVGTAFEANEYFHDPQVVAYFGLLGTPLDTPHVDLDLMLTCGGGEASPDFVWLQAWS